MCGCGQENKTTVFTYTLRRTQSKTYWGFLSKQQVWEFIPFCFENGFLVNWIYDTKCFPFHLSLIFIFPHSFVQYTKLFESYVILLKLMEMCNFLHITPGNLFSRCLLPFKILLMTNSGMMSFLTLLFPVSPGKMHHFSYIFCWSLDKSHWREAKPPLPTLGLQLGLLTRRQINKRKTQFITVCSTHRVGEK